jgi:prevent-host-death family protein
VVADLPQLRADTTDNEGGEGTVVLVHMLANMKDMKVVNVHAAKTQLSRLLKEVERGEEVTIARDGKPVARLVPVEARGEVQFGFLRGQIEYGPDFDKDLTPEDLGIEDLFPPNED